MLVAITICLLACIGQTFRNGGSFLEGQVDRTPQNGFISKQCRVWPQGVMPYEMAPNIGRRMKRMIQEIMKIIDTNTPFKFRPVLWNEEGQRVRFELHPGADSFLDQIGRSSDLVQVIFLSETMGMRVIARKIMYAMGRHNEINRPDRDQNVEVIWTNIDTRYLGKFDLISLEKITDQLPYDLSSVMHFSPFEYSSNGNATFQSILPLPTDNFHLFSQLDYLHIHLVYGRATFLMIRHFTVSSDAGTQVNINWKAPRYLPDYYTIESDIRLRCAQGLYTDPKRFQSLNAVDENNQPITKAVIPGVYPTSYLEVRVTAVYNVATLDDGVLLRFTPPPLPVYAFGQMLQILRRARITSGEKFIQMEWDVPTFVPVKYWISAICTTRHSSPLRDVLNIEIPGCHPGSARPVTLAILKDLQPESDCTIEIGPMYDPCTVPRVVRHKTETQENRVRIGALVTAIDSHRALVTWNLNEGSVHQARQHVTSYHIQLKILNIHDLSGTSERLQPSLITVPARTTQYRLEELSPRMEYELAIAATDKAGKSIYCSPPVKFSLSGEDTWEMNKMDKGQSQPGRLTKCTKCRMLGHAAENCPRPQYRDKICAMCGAVDQHSKQDCPEYPADKINEDDETFCTRCREHGHEEHGRCPQGWKQYRRTTDISDVEAELSDSMELYCSRFGQGGHRVVQCPLAWTGTQNPSCDKLISIQPDEEGVGNATIAHHGHGCPEYNPNPTSIPNMLHDDGDEELR